MTKTTKSTNPVMFLSIVPNTKLPNFAYIFS